jgi:hypothetical protein
MSSKKNQSQISSSASILRALLENAWKCDGKTPSREVWTQVLGCESSEPSEVVEKMGYLMTLFNDVRQDLTISDVGETGKYRRALDKFQSIFIEKQVLSGYWQDIQPLIGEETFDVLEACGEALERSTQNIIQLAPEEIDSMRQAIQELISNILDCQDIEDDLKQDLINQLNKISDALIHYRVRGSVGLVKACEEVTGNLFTNLWEQTIAGREQVSKVLGFVMFVGRSVRDIKSAKELPGMLNDLTHVLSKGVEIIQHLLPQGPQ